MQSISRRTFLKGVVAAVPALLIGASIKSNEPAIIEPLTLEPVTGNGMWSTNLGTAEPLTLESLEKAITAIGKYQKDSGKRLDLQPNYLILY